jgi:hypothetical protein
VFSFVCMPRSLGAAANGARTQFGGLTGQSAFVEPVPSIAGCRCPFTGPSALWADGYTGTPAWPRDGPADTRLGHPGQRFNGVQDSWELGAGSVATHLHVVPNGMMPFGNIQQAGSIEMHLRLWVPYNSDPKNARQSALVPLDA